MWSPPSGRRARFCAILASLAIFAALPAQEKPPAPPEPEEQEVLTLGAHELDAYATLCFKNGFPKRAREIWLEVIGEYAADDEAARKALGYYRNGAVWQLDGNFEYPTQETLDSGAAKMLEGRIKAVAQKLGDAHRATADKLAAAGKDARAHYHAQRALRWNPTDQKAAAIGGMKQVEGITGSEIDLEILRRSRLMDRAITKLSEQHFATKEADRKEPALEKSGLPYVGVQSENYRVYGDYEPEVLQQAAEWAERALLFCGEAFAGKLQPTARSKQYRTFVFFRKHDTWVRLVETNVSTVGRETAEFVTKNASGTVIGSTHTAAAEQAEIVYDLAVRWVVQDYTAFGADALEEGIGHAVVAMFFGRNLVFSVGQLKEQGTAASRTQQKLLLPDLDTWMQLATELAWSRTSTPATRLPLLKAGSFPTDGRIKAWSFCDYLLRRDPVLMRDLDATALKARNDNDVAAAFGERTKIPIQLIEDGWRRFWTEDSAIKRAILAKSTPLESASKEAPVWLEEFNRAREHWGGKPVGWSSQLSVDCKEHVDYLKANKDQRGPEKEHQQLAGKPGFSNSGRSFAQTAIVWTAGKDPKKALPLWLLIPGYRDGILNRNIDTVGIYAEGGIVVLDAHRGRDASPTGTASPFPRADLQGGRQKDPVPCAVDVELLGPEVEKLLAGEKRQKQKQVGFPISLSLYSSDTSDVTCKVTSRGAEVPGWFGRGAGSCGRTSQPGLWVFYPKDPLPKGVDITVEWAWPGNTHKVTFVTSS
ncbi:MAG: CAP domain-containing protein [Planctomycetota bacterium]